MSAHSCRAWLPVKAQRLTLFDGHLLPCDRFARFVASFKPFVSQEEGPGERGRSTAVGSRAPASREERLPALVAIDDGRMASPLCMSGSRSHRSRVVEGDPRLLARCQGRLDAPDGLAEVCDLLHDYDRIHFQLEHGLSRKA
jgi:hypothetical protein